VVQGELLSENPKEPIMTSVNFEQKLRALLQRQPFRPFVIELNDGEQWVVGQREALMYQHGGTAIYFRLDGSFDFVDSENVKQLLELTTKAPA
jgi:hypothetical protein